LKEVVSEASHTLLLFDPWDLEITDDSNPFSANVTERLSISATNWLCYRSRSSHCTARFAKGSYQPEAEVGWFLNSVAVLARFRQVSDELSTVADRKLPCPDQSQILQRD